MHPVIRIICFVIFTVFVSHPVNMQMVLASLLILLLLIRYARASMYLIGRMLLRLRWFFLSILLIYGWLSPANEPSTEVMQTPHSWLAGSAMIDGLQQGLLRIGTLVLIMSAAALLISLTRREQLVSAIYWLSTPLTLLGCSRDKLAVRLVLTLEYTKQLQLELGQRESVVQRVDGIRARLKLRVQQASELFSYVIKKAHAEPVDSLTIDLSSAPSPWQWLYPLLLGIVFYLAGHYAVLISF